MQVPYYPVNDFGPLMKGMIIGGLGIFHVFLAQFAIGGGMLMCYFQWLAQSGRSAYARKFLDSYFKVLVLISFVIGALTGVAMWFTSIQVGARTIGLMIDEFHWLWATEWTFFVAEIFAGYAFYRYGPRLRDSARMTLLLSYTFAAWCSLFWINGILAWQLTPGDWVVNHDVWAGFFNPSFLPSLLFRTIAAMTIASLVGCVVINAVPELEKEARTQLINLAAWFLAPMILMPALGGWYLLVMPDDSRSWVLGGSPAMTIFMQMAFGASLLIGLYAAVGLIFQRLYINGATATLLCALAFAATAGGEFVREGARKPFTIRQALYSNSIRQDEVAQLRGTGAVTFDPYPMRDGRQYPTPQVMIGAKVYRFLCAACHTLEGINGMTHLTRSWSTDQLRMNLAKLQQTKPFMPPFAGNAVELEALVQFLRWQNHGSPGRWPESKDPAVLGQLRKWLDEAGTAPASASSMTWEAK